MTHHCRRCGEAGHNVRTCTRNSFPVTDPDLDAPDGAVVDGFQRSGDRWVATKRSPYHRPRNSAARIVDIAALQTRVDRYREVLDCPHYQDNQGLCHQCGIVMDPALAKAEGAT